MKFNNLIVGSLILLTSHTQAGQQSVDTTGKLIYPDTQYQETYRNQFHYSPQAGWMNDVNGVFYQNGLYHLTFQHYPYSNEWNDMHWGYATSKDLLHWTQHNPAIVPGKNSVGMAYSGTAAIDHHNTLGLQKGNTPTVVMAFTDIKAGQSLVYSQDGGKTWIPHAKNPVMPPKPNTDKIEDRRDPKIFFYEPDNKWIMSIFVAGEGMEFHSSPNLIDWTYHSTFNAAGFWECPDMFQLPIEGTTQKKWVFVGAKGVYKIGDFDGETFTPKSETYELFSGIDLYGGQSFTDNTNRRIHLAWLGMWERNPVKSTWNHAVSFPTKLTLVNTPDGLRLSRTPIKEISNLYQKTKVWPAQTLNSNKNLLADEAFGLIDLTAEFDLKTAIESTKISQSEAKIHFNIANKTLSYDLKENTFDGIPIPLSNGKLKIRLLIDKGAVEFFVNDGLVSRAEEFAFDATQPLALLADTAVKLESLTLHRLKSTW